MWIKFVFTLVGLHKHPRTLFEAHHQLSHTIG
ncbi:hypothetical protein TGAM01_v201846 [Trichoderma gamsii]|uniref:Uncharacterized protein n=1 Tax=Trichoderma gamsii TaxID=398673 RepID=A0A2P4ZZ71_9HYPO|nr:hypothetical protein TGAM01_v201846 [Trichoderma gamsii]PON29597.1 hypothetical protein TGAM01_v201846 [Trichoderma gamsii]